MNRITINYEYPDRALAAAIVAKSVIHEYAGMIPSNEDIEIHLGENMIEGSIEWETGSHRFVVRHSAAIEDQKEL